MKRLFKMTSVFLASLAICLASFSSQASFVFAAVNTEVPSLSTVSLEAKATASYVIGQDRANIASIADKSSFRAIARDIILANKAGVDVTADANSFLDKAKSLMNADGSLNLTNPYGTADPNAYTAANYAELIEIVNMLKLDASNFNGVNLYTAFNNSLKDASLTQLSDASYLNPYLISEIYACLNSYKANFTDYATINANIITTIKTITTSDGVNYYGYSADNDGNTLAGFSTLYKTDAEFATVIDAIVAKHRQTSADSSGTVYTDPETGAVYSYGALNSDSTALSLAFLSEYGTSADAATKYNALITNFKSTTTNGAYTYDGADSLYSSRDALIGLVAYLTYGQLTTQNTSNASEAASESLTEAVTKTVTETPTNQANDPNILDSAQTSDSNNAAIYLAFSASSALLLVYLTKKNKLAN